MVDGIQGRGVPGRWPGVSRLVPSILPHVAEWGDLAPYDDLLGGGIEVGDGLAGYSSKQHSVAPPF